VQVCQRSTGRFHRIHTRDADGKQKSAMAQITQQEHSSCPAVIRRPAAEHAVSCFSFQCPTNTPNLREPSCSHHAPRDGPTGQSIENETASTGVPGRCGKPEAEDSYSPHCIASSRRSVAATSGSLDIKNSHSRPFSGRSNLLNPEFNAHGPTSMFTPHTKRTTYRYALHL